jgi:hypothetical protein
MDKNLSVTLETLKFQGKHFKTEARPHLPEQDSNSSGTRAQTDKWDCIKLKSAHSKGNNDQSEETAY